jgi:glycosyltransferase involved in cell wall biosynthesis
LKILHISTNDFGGAGIAAIRLHKALLHNNIDSNFLCLNKTSIGTPYTEKFVQKKAYWLFRLLRRLKLVRYAHESNTQSLRDKTGNYEMFSFPGTDCHIANHPLVNNADIIHLHWVANFLDWDSFFKKVKKPIVWTLHDMNPFLGGFHYLEDRNRNQALFQHLEEKYISVKINAVKDKENMHIVCPSHWMYTQSTKSQILGKYPHSVIPNSIPVTTFKPLDKLKSRAIFGLPPNKKIILFVAASLSNPRKGFELLLKALDHLNSEDYVLAVVGYSSWRDFPQTASFYNLGQIEDEELLAAAYSTADIFVIPSIEDNLPNTMLESLACGTPIVGFNIGGIPDVVIDGFNGFMATKVEYAELYHTIMRALYYNFDRQKIYEDTLKRFGPDIQAGRYINLYNSLNP